MKRKKDNFIDSVLLAAKKLDIDLESGLYGCHRGLDCGNVGCLYRAVFSKLPVIVIAQECTDTGFLIKAVISLFPRKGMSSLTKEEKKLKTFYLYFKEDDYAYLDQDSKHFFEKFKKGKPFFEGNWQEVMVKTAGILQGSPNSTPKQEKFIKAISAIKP